MKGELVVEQLVIRNEDAQAVWEKACIVAPGWPTRVLVDDEVVWESQP